MKKRRESTMGRTILPVAAALSLWLLAGCAYPATRQAPAPEPAPCEDPVYGQLTAEHPDRLSEREWQRLQVLDHECRVAREDTRRETHDSPGTHHSGAWWMGAGLIMTLMMAGMWIL